MLAGMRTALILAIAACGHPATRPATPSTTAGAAVKRVFISLGRVSGRQTSVVGGDGTIRSTYDVLENGRGPHVEAEIRLAADGTIASFEATGHRTMGT